jgi:hypothetical protein
MVDKLQLDISRRCGKRGSEGVESNYSYTSKLRENKDEINIYLIKFENARINLYFKE